MDLLLTRKLRRDLSRQRWQVLAVAIVMAMGIALFVTSAAAYRDLRDSYAAILDQLKLADLTISGVRVSPATIDRIRKVPGIAEIEGRTVVDLSVLVPAKAHGAGPLKVDGRFISLPAGRQPALDRLQLESGGLPSAPGEVVVERHFASYHHLEAGSQLAIDLPGYRNRTLRVAGVAASPEYLWVSRSRSDPMPTPTEFGVFWISRRDLATIAQAASAGLLFSPASWGLLAGGIGDAADLGSSNEVLCRLTAGASWLKVDRTLESVAGRATITHRSQLPSLKLLQMDLDSMRGMAWFFPLGFLVVGAFVAAAVQGRLVDAQRTTIGTLLALGMDRQTLLLHYLALAFLPGAAGALVGAMLGMVGASGLAADYAREFGIPAVTVHLQPDIVLGGLAIGLAVSAIAGWPAAWKAAGLAPAEAMRPAAGRSLPLLLALSRRATRHLPLILALPVRNLMRRPVRATLTALGIAAALVLVFVTGATMDGTEAAFSTQLDQSERYDLRADFYLPRPIADLARAAAILPGVKHSEVALTLPVELFSGSSRRTAALVGLPPDSSLLRTVDYSGRPVIPSAGQVVLARGLAGRLGVTVGSRLRVRSLLGNRAVNLIVSGLSDTAMGGGASMLLNDAGRTFGWAHRANTVLVTCSHGDLRRVRAELQSLPALARIQDRQAFRDMARQMMGLAFALVGFMMLFAAVLAAAVLFNTATISVLERSRELATLRALGFPFGTLAGAILIEHAILAGLAYLIGLPAAVALVHRVLALYNSDLFSLPFALSERTLAMAFGGVLIVLLLALWPNLRVIRRANLAQAVRERGG